MKLFWKQFVGILAILIMMFTIFGSILLQSSFQMWLNRELDSALGEITMFQYAFLTSAEGLPEAYQADRSIVVNIVETIEENIGDKQDAMALYDAYGKLLYKDGTWQGSLQLQDAQENNIVWQLNEKQGVHYLESISRVVIGSEVYYLECNRSFQHVFDNRDDLLQKYRITMAVLLVVAAGLAMAFAFGFTAPIRRLSQATRAFAQGNYESRVKSKGNDEIADLMRDFNAMADKLETNIWELNDAVRRQEEFTGAFAHELKTPLTSIIGYSEVLMSTELSEEARMMSASYIYQDGKRLERLAYKMMELARVDKQEIPFQQIGVTSLMKSLRATTLPLMTARNITLKIDAQEGFVYGDKDLLLSLLLNLVDNARKACSRDGHITILGHMVEKGYQLEIRDDGRGIPAEELPKITEAFYMVDKSRARKEGGAGLGMALCAKILTLHHGIWRIKSEPQKGTVIGILLPGKEEP